MTKSRIKRVSAFLLAAILTIASATSVSAAAQSLEYSASSSYKSSKYYKNLTEVKLTGDQATDIVNVAKSQVGYLEGYSSSDLSGTAGGSGNVTEYGRWYGRQGYWCNVFVSWCAYVAGVPADVFPKLSGVGNAYYSTMPSVGAECFSFSSAKQLEPGDLIFSCTCSGSYGCIDHVGLVTGVDENTIYTVEGNMSDSVKACSYPASSGYSSYYHARINYVARPDYEDNSASAEETGNAASTCVFDGSVYALFDSGVSFEEAKELSVKAGGSLAVAESEEEIKALASLVEKGGFNRYYIAAEEDKCAVINSDGEIVKSSENRRATGFICEISLEDVKPSNSASFNGSKYEIYDVNVTYAQAQAIAGAKGGKLTVIDNQNKAMMLSLLLKNSTKYFTGATGTQKELQKIWNSFTASTKFQKENIAVLLNDGSRKLSVGEGFDKTQKTGFIVEYDDSKKHTVIYDANGGENAPIEKIAGKGEAVAVTHLAPTKNNKTFMGWAYTAKAKKADVEAGDKISLVRDTTLYAVWK